MKKIVLCVSLFLVMSALVYSQAVPLVHPLTNEPGFWVSENDMTSILQAFDMIPVLQEQIENTLVVNETLTLEFNILVDDYNNLKSKVGILWGMTLGVTIGALVGLTTYAIFTQGGK